MIHTFKLNGVRAAVDSRDGSVTLLDELCFHLLPEMPHNPTAEMPTSLRYAFAKYDSRDLTVAYSTLYTLLTAKKEPYAASRVSSVTIELGTELPTKEALKKLTDSEFSPSEEAADFVENRKAAVILDARTSSVPALAAWMRAMEGRWFAAMVPWTMIRTLQETKTEEKNEDSQYLANVVFSTKTAETADVSGPSSNPANGPSLLILEAAKEEWNNEALLHLGKERLSTVLSFSFDASDDLCAAVTTLFEEGVPLVSAYPAPKTDSAAVIAQYDKLSREMARRKKRGASGCFTPFLLGFYAKEENGSHLWIGKNGDCQKDDFLFEDTFAAAYARSGCIAHLTDALLHGDGTLDSRTDNRLIDVVKKCVECSVCLSAL